MITTEGAFTDSVLVVSTEGELVFEEVEEGSGPFSPPSIMPVFLGLLLALLCLLCSKVMLVLC